MAKTEKELQELKKKVEELNKELKELSGEELMQIAGGVVGGLGCCTMCNGAKTYNGKPCPQCKGTGLCVSSVM